MAEFIDYFKIIMDYLKSNKWLVLLILSGASSVATNVSQFIGIQDKEAEITASHKQIENIANYYTKTTVKPSCGDCMAEHERRLH